jgi:hypothetical protein
MLGPTEHPGAGEIPGASLGSSVCIEVTEGMSVLCFGDSHTPPVAGDDPPLRAGIGHTDLWSSMTNLAIFGNLETIHVWRCGGIHTDLFGGVKIPPAVGDIHAGLWGGDMLTGIKGPAPFSDDVNTPGFAGAENMPIIGDMHAGIIHTGLYGDSHDLPSARAAETGRVRSCGLIHSDLLSDIHCASIGEIGTGPVRFCGHMETTFISVTSTGNCGAMSIGPAKSCGDIYATGSLQHAWDVQTTLAVGNMYAGLWAGRMYTGAARRCGDMETT